MNLDQQQKLRSKKDVLKMVVIVKSAEQKDQRSFTILKVWYEHAFLGLIPKGLLVPTVVSTFVVRVIPS